jgi:hypothetical protein
MTQRKPLPDHASLLLDEALMLLASVERKQEEALKTDDPVKREIYLLRGLLDTQKAVRALQGMRRKKELTRRENSERQN